MRRLIVAGLLYLTGISVILVIKPQSMFREDGRWKEFGIGRDPKNFTFMPFWMFAIIWAVIAYITVSLLENVFYGEDDDEPIQVRNYRPNNRNRNKQKDLVPGYYMLNQESTGRNGVPRYVYVGPEEPDV